MDPGDLKRLQQKVKELSDFSEKELILSLRHAADNAVGRMKQKAPVLTGRLRREIEYTKERRALTLTSEAIDPDTKIDYAPIQEHGGRNINPQPYFYQNIRLMIHSLTKDLIRKLKLISNN